MNKVVTSREEILKAAKELIVQGDKQFSMRTVASRCSIAVGSIYNYFPTRDDLVLAVVSQVWEEIFRPVMSGQKDKGFFGLVESIQAALEEGSRKYPRFFADHAVWIPDKEQGRRVMDGALQHMREALTDSLRRDSAIRENVWSEKFTPEAFADFILNYLCESMTRRPEGGVFLRELMVRTIYPQ